MPVFPIDSLPFRAPVCSRLLRGVDVRFGFESGPLPDLSAIWISGYAVRRTPGLPGVI
jgi:hypothetical protein